MTNEELEMKLSRLVHEERRITKEILDLVSEADKRRLYLDKGFGSLFDWLVKGFGYSESAAYRRIQAARLINAVPEASEKLTSGGVNLTTLAQAQTAIRQEEKRTGERITPELKKEIVQRIEGMSSNEAQKVLCAVLPESKPVNESFRSISTDTSRLSIVIDGEGVEALERCKELLSHKMPEASWSEIVTVLAKGFIERIAPVLKAAKVATSAPVSPRTSQFRKPIRRAVRRMVLARAGHACEFVDSVSGRRCSSRFRVEVDHVQPLGHGGSDEIGNLRCLCKLHNLRAAERALGRKKMQKFRSRPH